ncbi:hypothetical protein KJ570_03670 [Patescibacteria group bacterium]|nr:hypothetical protein [Patescibacteria group bacterium]MBU2035988.1 hypothetical protein [Patescibacteria group bacterium]
MTKFKEYFQRMIEQNQDAFDKFRTVHNEYTLNPDPNQENYNIEGKKILKIIKEWESKLCNQQEKTYSQYAGKLAEKFWEEVRKEYPMIDHIGIIVKKFNLKKINLN